jgi:hypothetical protein
MFEKGNSHMHGFSILVSKVGLVVTDVSIENKALEKFIVVVGMVW